MSYQFSYDGVEKNEMERTIITLNSVPTGEIN